MRYRSSRTASLDQRPSSRMSSPMFAATFAYVATPRRKSYLPDCRAGTPAVDKERRSEWADQRCGKTITTWRRQTNSEDVRAGRRTTGDE